MPELTQDRAAALIAAQLHAGLVVSRRIREVRIDAGMNRADLARAADVSNPQVRDIEEGRSSPTIRTLARIAHALNVSVASLLEGA